MKTLEKRQYKRILCNFPLQYRGFDPDLSSQRGGFTKDISEGGVRFISFRFIPVATDLSLNLSLPVIFRPLKVTSKVIWIRKLPVGDYYEVGLKFIDISKNDRSKIGALTHPASTSYT